MAKKQAVSSLGELLLHEGLITKKQLDRARALQKEEGKSLGRVLVEMGAISDTLRLNLLRRKFGFEIFSLNTEGVETTALTFVPREVAFRHHVVPIRFEGDQLLVAMEDPTDLEVLDSLKTFADLKIKPVLVTLEELEEALKKYPAGQAKEAIALPRVAPLWLRGIRFVVFTFFWLFLPAIIFAYLTTGSERFQRFLSELSGFDIFLYMVLAWGMWVAILYEIYSLLFPTEKKPPRPPEELK